MNSHTNERSPLNGSVPVASLPARNRTRSQSRLATIVLGVVLAVALVLAIYLSSSANETSTNNEAATSSGGQVAPPSAVGTPAALINGSEPWSCGDTAYDAGYIKLANKNDDQYFYWFVESSSAQRAEDPLVLWLTGGPGGSSMAALLTENGPCTVNANGTTTPNPYSWTQQANVIWLDQPTGVGFSYSNAPQEDADSDELNVGENIYWFLQGFLERHPQFDGRAFFITGESYAGHYIPGAAHYIWQQNTKKNENESAQPTKHINLQGVAIGNGHTDPVIQYQHNVDMAFNSYNISLLSDQAIEQMRADSRGCIALTQQCQQAPRQGSTCVDAVTCWNLKLVAPFSSAHRNTYDLRKPCTSEVQVGSIAVCGFDFSRVATYLSQPQVREALHVRVPEWTAVSGEVMDAFVTSGDFSFSYSSYVADLLDGGVRVLIYAGDADLACNWIGNQAWTLALEWRGKQGYNNATERPFRASLDPRDESEVDTGVVRSFENFAFLRVFNAGHMVPEDEPAVALTMLNKFLRDEQL